MTVSPDGQAQGCPDKDGQWSTYPVQSSHSLLSVDLHKEPQTTLSGTVALAGPTLHLNLNTQHVENH